MRRLSGDAWILLGLMLLVIGGSYFLVREQVQRQQFELVPHRTANNSRPGGVRALYLTLRELGYRVEQHRLPLTRLPPHGVLFIFEPQNQSLSNREWSSLLDWVKNGNAALLASDGIRLDFPLTPVGNPMKALSTPESQARPRQVSALTQGVKRFAVKSSMRLNADEWGPASPGIYVPRNPPPGAGGVITPPRMKSAGKKSRPIDTILEDASGVVAAIGRWGSGTIVLLTSPGSLSNAMLAHADNFRFTLNFLRTFAPDRSIPVLFDEYHQGFSTGRSIFAMFGAPHRIAGVQLAVGFLMLLYLLSRRFGQPIPLSDGIKRTRSEYLSSMALFLQRARAVEAVRSALGAEFIRDITKALGLPQDATMDQIATAAQDRKGIDPQRMRSALAACGPGASHSITNENDLLNFARALSQIKKECRVI